MKTLIFNGSPRAEGDTSALISLLAEKLPGEIKVVNAYRCGISPCVDCRYCWTNPGCAVMDAMQSVYAYIQECDNVVIASPLYFSELTGPMLSIGSRFQTYFCARHFRKETPIAKPKKGAVILVGGGDGNASKAYDTACCLLRMIHCTSVFRMICSHQTDSIPAVEDRDAVEAVNELAGFLSQAGE